MSENNHFLPREAVGALVIACALYLAAALSLFLKWPIPSPDEAVFADSTANLLRTGTLGTSLIHGMEHHVYWQPPVYFLFIAGVMKFTGFGLAALRVASLIIGLGIIAAQTALGWRLKLRGTALMLCSSLLAFNPNFVNYVTLARMDGLCVLLMLGGILLYLDEDGHPNLLRQTGAGVCLSLSFLTHPLGAIGIAAVLLHFLWARRGNLRGGFPQLACLGLPVLVGCILWGIYIAQDPPDFALQMEFQMGRKGGKLITSVWNFLVRYRSIPLLGFVMAAAIPAVLVRAWRRRERGPVFLAIVTLVSLSAVAVTFETPYHVYVLPFGCITAALMIETLRSHSRRTVRWASFLVVAAIAVNFGAYFLAMNYEQHFRLGKETDYAAFTSAIASALPDSSVVCLIGPLSPYWGLRSSGKGLVLRDNVFLSDSLEADAFRRINAVVVSSGFTPVEADGGLMSDVSAFREKAARHGKNMKEVFRFGTQERFAYTGVVFLLSARPDLLAIRE